MLPSEPRVNYAADDGYGGVSINSNGPIKKKSQLSLNLNIFQGRKKSLTKSINTKSNNDHFHSLDLLITY